MKKSYLYAAWLILYILCTILSSIQPESTGLSVFMTMLSLCFFVPGGLLLHRALKEGDRKEVLRLRLISGLSLGLTFLLIVLNFLSLGMSEAMGNFLYALLIIVSCPMVCSQYWVLSLFLWACLLTVTVLYAPKKK